MLVKEGSVACDLAVRAGLLQQTQVAQTQTAGVRVLVPAWSWRPPAGWHESSRDAVGTHLPLQGLLIKSPAHPAHPVPFLPTTTTSHPLWAMAASYNVT